MQKLQDFCMNKQASIMQALRAIDYNKKGFLIVVDDENKVVGTLTDGDIRRGMIAGRCLEDGIEGLYCQKFIYLHVKDKVTSAIDPFKDGKVQFIPILDSEMKFCNVITKRQMQSLLLLDIHADLTYDFLTLDENIIDYEIFQRPWGFYKTTAMNPHFQSKVISVKPKGQLSLQSHNRREQHWIISYGQGLVQIDDSFIPVYRGSSLFIPKGAKHRLTNTDEKESLIITEVQIGDYFGEDDIIRYDDIYGRVGNQELAKESEEIKPRVKIKMFLTDCDGCLTDGGMYYSEAGDELKKFNTRDGMGFALLREQGIITGIITGEDRELNRRRAKKLNLDIIESGCKDKLAAVKRYCEQYQISLEQVCYIGDDINDLELLQAVGLSCCPADAVEKVRAVVDYVATTQGGRGVIREVVETHIRE